MSTPGLYGNVPTSTDGKAVASSLGGGTVTRTAGAQVRIDEGGREVVSIGVPAGAVGGAAAPGTIGEMLMAPGLLGLPNLVWGTAGLALAAWGLDLV